MDSFSFASNLFNNFRYDCQRVSGFFIDAFLLLHRTSMGYSHTCSLTLTRALKLFVQIRFFKCRSYLLAISHFTLQLDEHFLLINSSMRLLLILGDNLHSYLPSPKLLVPFYLLEQQQLYSHACKRRALLSICSDCHHVDEHV